MPFKHKLIKEFQKYHQHICNQPLSDKRFQATKNQATAAQKSTHKKKITQKHYSLFRLVLTREPTETPHVFNFLNLIGINQNAIKNPDFDESMFSTLYYVKNVKKVQIKSNLVIVTLGNIPCECPPIQYLTQRFKSFGDIRFYKLAVIIQQIFQRLQVINSIQPNEKSQDKSQFIDKYIQSLGNKLFYIRTSSTKAIYSKSFLEALQYDPEDFALDCTRFKACDREFTSRQIYYDIAFKALENIRNLMDLLQDNISLQSFLSSSLLRFRGLMFTKNKKQLLCKLKAGMPNPIIHLFEIQQVINRSAMPFEQESQYLKKKKLKVQDCKQQRKQIQIEKIRKLAKIPKNLLPENQHLVTGYTLKESQLQNVSIQATDY